MLWLESTKVLRLQIKKVFNLENRLVKRLKVRIRIRSNDENTEFQRSDYSNVVSQTNTFIKRLNILLMKQLQLFFCIMQNPVHQP